MMQQMAKVQEMTQNDLQQMANAIRALAMDAVQRANSGHPGMPMGMADVATVLYSKFLSFDAATPEWPNRDRLILSAGHGSMLLYSLLYLTGNPQMTIDQLKNFRQWGSLTPGHPEYKHTPGVETTTGPLGQGLANGVGMALATKMKAARYGADLIDHKTYVIVGDGCLMEGISHEAISFAGHLKLDNLIVLFDDNSISIDGSTDLAVSDDQLKRFEASGWDVSRIDGHDFKAIEGALSKAQIATKPVLIACKTIIGKGAPTKQGTASTHGSPLGPDEIEATRKALGWTSPPFEIPASLLDSWREVGSRGQSVRKTWESQLASNPARDTFERELRGELPHNWDQGLNALIETWTAEAPALATRQSSEKVLDVVALSLPELIGGSADLTGSNNTKAKTMTAISAANFKGDYIHYGVREHGMAAIMNGLAIYGGFIPFGGTFLVFTDYLRPGLRLSALMGLRVIYVMTHDSIGLGEDGPTHQPIEHLASLRAMPGVNVFRPADAVEVAECWKIAIQSPNTPSVLALTRQKLPALRTAASDENLCARGGYVLSENEDATVTLMATGSEVSLAANVQKALADQGIPARVVSLPCWELFDAQDAEYKSDVLGGDTLRVAIEAASPFGWERYTGTDGLIFGLDHFGASAPFEELYQHFGLTVDHIVNTISAALDM